MLLPSIEKKVQMMEILKLVTLLLIYDITGSSTQSLPCRTARGDNCTSSICPNTVVTYTCTITNGTAAGLTDWTLPTGTCPFSIFPNTIRLSQYSSQQCSPQSASMCGPNTASSILPSFNFTYCLSSILTVNITAAMNGKTVTCSNTNIVTTATTVVSMATINVVGPPGAPNVMAKTIGPDMVLVVVNLSSSGGLPTSYNVTISNSSCYVYAQSTSAFPNGSAMVTFIGVGLTNSPNYSISAVAINCAGSSISSNITTILVSWPAPTTSPSPSSGTTTSSPTTATTQNPTPGAAGASVAGPVAGGVIGGTILVLLTLTIAILILKLHRAHPVDQKKVVELQENTAYGVVQKREVVDVKENTAYGMIPQADTGKVDSTYDNVQSIQTQKQ